MIVLDTNVVSALLLPQPDRLVTAWLDRQSAESLWITAINYFELQLGLELLAAGRRRDNLAVSVRQLVFESLAGRILDFDAAAAEATAKLSAERRRKGCQQGVQDTQIAGIVISRRATLATRNIGHFEDTGVRVVNPWTD